MSTSFQLDKIFLAEKINISCKSFFYAIIAEAVSEFFCTAWQKGESFSLLSKLRTFSKSVVIYLYLFKKAFIRDREQNERQIQLSKILYDRRIVFP